MIPAANMKVQVPQDAPVSTPATSQLYTSSIKISLTEISVTVTTTANKQLVVAHYVDTEGKYFVRTQRKQVLVLMEYRTTKPDTIPANGASYHFKEVKQVLMRNKVNMLLTKLNKSHTSMKDTWFCSRSITDVKYACIWQSDKRLKIMHRVAPHTQPLTNQTSVRTNGQGLTETVTTHYEFVRTPDNAMVWFFPSQTITVV